MMERRLLIAQDLLNPAGSALIVTIDEKEYLRLGILLQQTFPDASMQMISTLINSKGTGRANEFRRVDEYIYFLWFGGAKLGRLGNSASPTLESDSSFEAEESDEEAGEQDEEGDDSESEEMAIGLDWQTFRRRDLASLRGTKKGGPRQFYPIYVNIETGHIEAVGDPLPHDMPRTKAPERKGCVAVFPIRRDGTEMNWATIGPTFVKRWKDGYARAGRATPDQPQKTSRRVAPQSQGGIRTVQYWLSIRKHWSRRQQRSGPLSRIMQNTMEREYLHRSSPIVISRFRNRSMP
jgi:adenine-specific DNA-methyltransferase